LDYYAKAQEARGLTLSNKPSKQRSKRSYSEDDPLQLFSLLRMNWFWQIGLLVSAGAKIPI
jgi:hypothetical protein